MSKGAEKFGRPLKYLSYGGVFIGFAGMGLIAFELVRNIIKMLTQPGSAAGVGIIQPFAPHIPGTIFVPFFYFIISIFIIAVIHEFSHGIIARVHNLKVKSSGFAFLGVLFPIIPAAFVEPDEKKIGGKTVMQQLSIYAAGPFSNIILAFIILGIFFTAFVPLSNAMMEMKGTIVTDFSNTIESPAELAGMKKGELITQIDGISLTNTKLLNEIINKHQPGDTLIVTTNETVHRIILAENPEKQGAPIMGIMAMPYSVVKESFKEKYGTIIPKIISWFAGLFQWLFILSLGIGLFNLVPLGPIDGGRMVKTVLYKYFKKEKAHRIFVLISASCLAILFFNIFLAIIG